LDCRHNFAAENARGNIPVGAKDNISHFPCEYRSLRVQRLANHYPHIQSNVVVLIKGAQPEIWNVDDDRGSGEFGGQPAPTLQRELQLEYAILKWHIDLLDGGAPEPAIVIQTMAPLEALDRLDQRPTVGL